jgi:hypothetical protein
MFSYFIEKLRPFVFELLVDQYGVKVISKIIFEFPLQNTSFLFNFIIKNFFPLSINKISTNLILNLLFVSNLDLMNHLLIAYQINFKSLIFNSNGSYFVQNLIMRGNPEINYLTAKLVLENLIEYAQHKVASEVIEILIDFGQPFIKNMFIECNLNYKTIETLLFDASGNYGIFYLI